jgi:phosphoribosylaminoimidazole-succinocarboxamide synthase
MTSVKEFVVEAEPTAESPGRGRFRFTDRYSVFDWGEMPDHIPEKGASLCAMGADNFERLEAEGIPTHYRGVGPDAVPLGEAADAPTEMAIELVNVPDLPHEGREYDYDAYHAAAGDYYLVPLEIVFRNEVPEGSSLRSRTEPADHGLGFDTWPEGTVELEEPVVEFSTKYEESDRYLGRGEAADIAGEADVYALESVARSVNEAITERAAETGFVHQDGKIECCYADGEIRVADVAGTFDENRFSFDGVQVSKEFLRQYHKRTQPEWVEAVAEAKSAAKERGVADWRALCGVEPQPLPDSVVGAARDLYAAGAKRYTGSEFFDAPPMADAVRAVGEL